MLISVFLLFIAALFIYVSKIDKYEKSFLIKVLIVILLWNFIWLVFVQAELFYKGVYTYGSDAQYYYDQALIAIESSRPFNTAIHSRLAPLYVFFEVLVLEMSPNLSSIWIKISNVVLVEVFFVILYFWLRRYVKNKNLTLSIILMFGLNGIVTWTALRELKDTLFILLVLINLSVLDYLLRNGRSLLAVLFSVGMSILFFYLRMFATALPFGLLIVFIIAYRKEVKKELFLWFGLAILFIAVLQRNRIRWFYTGLLYYAGRFKEPLEAVTNNVLLQYILAPFRFIIGPGPIRALASSDVFVVTTNVGNILIFLGSILWWLFLPILLMSFIFNFKFVLQNIYLFATPLFIDLMYSFMYFGTGDTRLRATVYLLFLPGLIKYIDFIAQEDRRKVLMKYIVTSLFAWLGGLLLSIFTLVY